MSIQHTEDPPSGGDASSPAASKKRKAALDEIEVDLTLPEPPSKKARRALKKGKSLPANTPTGDKDTDENNDAASKKASRKKPTSAHGVWIGNLPFTVTKAELRKWLVDNSGGTITDDSITRVHLPTTRPDPAADKKNAKRFNRKRGKPGSGEDDGEERPEEEEDEDNDKGKTNKGFAYVDFSTYEATVAAIALSETSLGGRKLLIKDSKNFDGRPRQPEEAEAGTGPKDESGKPTKDASSTKPAHGSTKIFVGNLGFKANEDELWAHFEKCGPIRWVKVATFEDTGKCKGYAWVNFQEAEAAAWAVKGFVKIRETIETIEDFMEEGADGGDDKDGDEPEDAAAAAANPERSQLVRRTKTRKWWVNQLHGRSLKIELAEDDKVRYKKRFGKGANANAAGGDGASAKAGPRRLTAADGEDAVDGDRKAGAGAGPRRDERKAKWENKERTEKEDVQLKFHDDINVARLTGATVKPQGVKVTFD